MSYLTISNLSACHGNVPVLHDISLEVRKGEFISILGPSGCGKTTLLMGLAGITPPSKGSISLGGVDITTCPPERRNFGVVFQNYALFPNLTVEKNISYGLHGAAWTKTRCAERVQNVLDITGLAGFVNRFPHELSGGQQQRVALARALAPEPKLLLLDEPLSALDAQVRVTLGEELRRIQRTCSITTILVTHDQQEALSLADRVVLMCQGGIEQVGSPYELYENPATKFVATFVGSMNVLSMPAILGGRPVGVRYEHVQIHMPSEQLLEQPFTWVGRIERLRIMGSFIRLELLLNDFITRIQADIPKSGSDELELHEQNLVAVSLPQERWCIWQE